MLSMYEASIPVLKRTLTNLAAILKKGEQYADARKIEHAVLLNARLFPDMYPLTRQVQIATDMSKGAAARLAGLEVPKYEDNETTFAELQARITKTIAFIDTVKPAQFEGSESREVTITVRQVDLKFKGQDYLLKWVNPNVYFHVTTAYNILRHNGVELGKVDFLGPRD
ncbi:MAG: DUF1993 domain-containing protein [Methylotenera sp.]|uniref:DUF1993 domain-containing protein n=1 Tax=Methylotenera sp. TaxID=2051956 RepID=UPI001825532E|nr:DUF1993 domain-containing protein [Methylotenera sp.]NOU24434.1 DUF1993 domain-containing protein [Methylotenera sp.]